MFLVSSCSCLNPVSRSHALSWEWRCCWSSADRRCSNYIWVINNLIAHQGALILEIWRLCFCALKQSDYRTEDCLKLVSFSLDTHFHINSVWPSDTIWHKPRLIVAQVMVCCLMAPSHLNQCLLTISTFIWKQFHNRNLIYQSLK